MIVTFQGKTPHISPDAFVAETAVLIGDVTVGPDSSVWYGAVIRGDCSAITVGRGTSIQDNAVLHTEKDRPLAIGDNVTVGHASLVHCASVGSNTLVGMGAIILNDAVVGKNCIIGAGALVTGKKVIPDGSLVMGSPAVIKREVTQEELDRNLVNAAHYVELAQQYKAKYSG